MGSNLRKAAMLGFGTTLAVILPGCSSIQYHRGFIVDEVLIASVQPGLDNQASVRGVLGAPTVESQFGEPTWYYVSSRTTQAPFSQPRIADHTVLAVHFDAAGNVASVERSGIENVVRLSPEEDETPTLGRQRGFFEDLFGNIGVVGTGAPG